MSNAVRCILPSMLLCALPVMAWAADGESAPHPCATVALPAERLACYDKAFPPPPAVIEAAAKRVVDDFGLGESGTPLRNPGAPAVEPDRIESKISKVVYGARGGRTFTLENGQAWATTESTSSVHVVEGDAVTVRKGLLGNYLLATPVGSLRVRRVR